MIATTLAVLLAACAPQQAARQRPSAPAAAQPPARTSSGAQPQAPRPEIARAPAQDFRGQPAPDGEQMGEFDQAMLPPEESEWLVREPTSVEPESVLTRVGADTPPHVATALRLVEDARRLIDEGEYERAQELLERTVAIDPTNPYGYYFLAKVHHLRKNYGQAVAFANRAAMLSGQDPVWLGRVYCLQGAAYEEVGRYSDARRAYTKAIAADPNNVTAHVGAVRLSNPQ
jgi:tetratricopeptide (TPR) repeat protein